jgi:hypothetical protein
LPVAAGEIHVSDQCRAALGHAFLLEERGIVEIKGRAPTTARTTRRTTDLTASMGST